MPNLMVAPFLGNEEIQRQEAQEDSNGCEGRGSKELGTEEQGAMRPPRAGNQECVTGPGFSYRLWGSQLQPSRSHSKHFVGSPP